ncbi:MAG: MlaD family protein [Prevotellaceae bacterium]|nr:MlaD family protein [Prevotellaceae bacterium]
MKRISKEFQIAIVAIVGIVVLYAGLQFLKGLSVYSNDDTYYVSFKDISGLSPSCAVYANGYRIGVVKDIQFSFGADDQDIVAELGVDKRMRIPEGSNAAIESDMLGNVKLNIVLASSNGGQLNPGDTIRGNQEAGLMAKVGQMLPTVERMLPKLDSILANLNALTADPALENSLHNINKITDDLTVTTKHLNTLMAGVNKKVPSMLDKADATLGNTQKLTANLSEVDVAATMAKVNATLDNVHELTSSLTDKEGTIGLLMRDPSLYWNLSNTMRDADSLMIDLKAHPKRYVHFSIFGKKDK